ncbi:MAG: extracellular solute-binding protein [Pseudomonadota bacterium]|nr:extracellular solute-binding protein [Pseudomonadota bacterium]
MLIKVILTAAIFIVAGCVSEAKAAAEGLAALALDVRPGRAQRLLEGAKREGEVNVYTSLTASTAAKVKADFERRYGVRVNLWRASSENILQRVTTEARAGRLDFDIVETNGPEMEAIQREGLLQRVESGYFKDLISQALFPHREWVATRLNLFVQCFNTRLVQADEVPQSFVDLLDPRWKGRLAIEANDADWFQAVIQDMGEAKGLALFRELVSKNGLSVRKGHALLAELVTSGEIALSLTCYSFKVDQDHKAGAPIDWVSLGPLLARPNGGGISRKARHPHAALLFYEYLISDAQPMLAQLELIPVSARVKYDLKGKTLRFIDPARVLDESAKWEKLYQDIIVKRR